MITLSAFLQTLNNELMVFCCYFVKSQLLHEKFFNNISSNMQAPYSRLNCVSTLTFPDEHINGEISKRKGLAEGEHRTRGRGFQKCRPC